MPKTKLTKTQTELLSEIAKAPCYVPRSYRVGADLHGLGLIEERSEASCIFRITEAGRAALA